MCLQNGTRNYSLSKGQSMQARYVLALKAVLVSILGLFKFFFLLNFAKYN